MQITHPRRNLHPGVIIMNASMVLGVALLFVAYFGNWLEGPRLVGGLLLLLGLGTVAEGIMRRVGRIADTEKPKPLAPAWLLFYGVTMSLAGILMLFGY